MGEFAQSLHKWSSDCNALLHLQKLHRQLVCVWRLEVFQKPMLATDTRRDAIVLSCVLPNRTRDLDIYLKA